MNIKYNYIIGQERYYNLIKRYLLSTLIIFFLTYLQPHYLLKAQNYSANVSSLISTTKDPGILYSKGYSYCQDGKSHLNNGNQRAARQSLNNSIAILNAVKKRYPNWYPDIVSFRRKKVLEMLEGTNDYSNQTTNNFYTNNTNTRQTSSRHNQSHENQLSEVSVDASEATIKDALSHIQKLSKLKQAKMNKIVNQKKYIEQQYNQTKQKLNQTINEANRTKEIVHKLENKVTEIKSQYLLERKQRINQVTELKEKSTAQLLNYEKQIRDLKKQNSDALVKAKLELKKAEQEHNNKLFDLKNNYDEKLEITLEKETKKNEKLRVEFQNDYANLISQNSEIIDKLRTTHQNTVDSLKEENITLAQRLEKLSKFVSNTKEVNRILEDKNNKIENLTNERNRLRTALNQTLSVDEATLINRNAKLMHKLDKANQNIESLTKKQQALIDDNKSMMTKLSKLEENNKELQASNSQLLKENLDLKQLKSKLEIAKINLENERDSWKNQAQSLQAELSQTRNTLASIEKDNLKQLNTISKLEHQLTLQNQKIDNLKTEVSNSESKREIALLQNIIRSQLRKHKARKNKHEQLLKAIANKQINLNQVENQFAIMLKESEIHYDKFKKDAVKSASLNSNANTHVQLEISAPRKSLNNFGESSNLVDEYEKRFPTNNETEQENDDIKSPLNENNNKILSDSDESKKVNTLTDEEKQIDDKQVKVAEYYNNTALELIKEGLINQAKKNLSKALEYEPDNFKSISLMGRIHLENYNKQGYDLKEAISYFQKASTIEEGKKDSDIYFMLGLSYFLSRDMENSSFNLDQAIKFNPNYANAVFYRALVAKNNNKIDQATELLKRVIKINPDHKDAHYHIAFLYAISKSDSQNQKQKLLDKAKEHYEKSIELDAAPNPLIEQLIYPEKKSTTNNSKTAANL